jgi:hypothetical protein
VVYKSFAFQNRIRMNNVTFRARTDSEKNPLDYYPWKSTQCIFKSVREEFTKVIVIGMRVSTDLQSFASDQINQDILIFRTPQKHFSKILKQLHFNR